MVELLAIGYVGEATFTDLLIEKTLLSLKVVVVCGLLLRHELFRLLKNML